MATKPGVKFISGSELLISSFFNADITQKKARALKMLLTNNIPEEARDTSCMLKAKMKGMLKKRDNRDRIVENSRGETLNSDFFSATAAAAERIAETSARVYHSITIELLLSFQHIAAGAAITFLF